MFAAQTAQQLPSLIDATLSSDQSDFQLTKYVVVPMSAPALERLGAAADEPQQGVLSTVAVLPLTEAVSRLGPTSPPPDGWAQVVIEDAYGGANPGALDVAFSTLVAMLGERAHERGFVPRGAAARGPRVRGRLVGVDR